MNRKCHFEELVLKLLRSVNNVYESGISLRTVSICHSQPARWFDSVPGMHHSKDLVVTGFCFSKWRIMKTVYPIFTRF